MIYSSLHIHLIILTECGKAAPIWPVLGTQAGIMPGERATMTVDIVYMLGKIEPCGPELGI